MSCPSLFPTDLLELALSFFTPEQLALLDKQRIPQHVAIIPDGNRRWARLQSSLVEEGHREGADNLITIVKAAKALQIKTISFYLFSTENWSRDAGEVQALMWILENLLDEQLPEMLSEGIRFNTIGDISRLPETTIEMIEKTKAATAHCDKIDFVAALNYGSRDEITRAFKQILIDYDSEKIGLTDVKESLISSYLDTAKWPDPDLFIRTSGEMRISNFLLWQLSYSELYIAKTLWPDFTPRDLYEALLFYQSRDRRMGGGN
jgi:undecaprenyl diphosphate synthase